MVLGSAGWSGHVIWEICQESFQPPADCETSCKRATQRRAPGENSAATRSHTCLAAFSTAQGAACRVTSRGTKGSTEGGPHASITGATTPKHRLFHGHHTVSALCSPDRLRTRGHRQDAVARASLNTRKGRPPRLAARTRGGDGPALAIKSQKRCRIVTRKNTTHDKLNFTFL